MDTEVVITRKRKRQAVDPCLGYYQGIPPPNATKTNLKPLLPVTSHPYPSWSQATKNNVNAPTNVHEDLPTSPIQPAIERDLDHGERSLSPLPSSVEDFLKPTKKTVQRKYGQHARRVVLDSDDRNESAQDEDIPRSRSESPPPRKSKRLVKKSIQRDHENDDSDYQRQSPDDPCLGYYQGIPPLNATKAKPLLPVTSHPYPSWTQATKNNVPSHVIEDSPTSPIQPAIDDDLDYRERSVSPPPISVDDFLRQTKKTVRRKYGRHARRVVLDSDDRDAQEETSSRTRSEIPPPRNSTRLAKKKRIQLDLGSDDSDYQPQSPDESSSSESTPVKRKVTKVPLSKLLFTAAVLSNAHPMDSLAAGSSKEKVQRKPLRFQRPPSPSPPQKLYNLTDPRKTHPFDGSSFASKSSKISQRPCKPINTWVTPHSKLPPPPPGSKPFKPKLPASGPSVAASQPVRRRLVMIPASQAPPDRVRVRSQLTHSAKPPLPGTRIPLQFQECPLHGIHNSPHIFMAQYPYVRPGQSSKGISHNEFEILKNSHKFLRDDDGGDKPESWNDQLAAKYYDSLYREFAVCDLKHYKSGNFALRWRTEDEVLSGAGETSCGNTRCKHHAAPEGSGPSLSTLELPFAYEEQGKMKLALVKVVLCSKCVNKLMWKRRKEKESRAKASEGAAQDAGDARLAEKAVEASQAPSSKRKRRNDHAPGDATKKSRRDSKSDPVDGPTTC